ncbi:Hypothetical protein, putative [Bodo saltans]|uniref:Uncharacterized protein n=1 Tax=Bodo saltans TaxID=75058 RepID=A0A0S4KPQ6_BODSA|nr:Hypothetical protein, putative [Bodo saltans]|eukprot:CUI15623.1 Hypothetical protein, putative [Bodo saltans]
MNPYLAHTIPLAKGKDVHNRIAKLALYKECLALAISIEDRKSAGMTLKEVRTQWREHRGAGGSSLEVQLASVLDRIAYGRMCITKQRLRNVPNASEDYDWDVINPLENHAKRMHKKRSEKASPDAYPIGEGRRDFVPMTNWGGGNVMDPDVTKKHKELTERQFFMGPTWRAKPKPVMLEDLSFEEQMHMHFQPKPKMRKTPKKEY